MRAEAALDAATQAGARDAATDPRIGDVLDAYARTLEKRTASPRSVGILRQSLEPFFGDLYVSALNGGLLEEFAAEAAVSGPTVRRYLGALSAALTWGQRVGGWKNMVVPWIEKPPEGQGRQRWLTEDEAAQLFAAAAADEDAQGRLTRAGLFVCIGLLTGARMTAILELEWSRVDLARGMVDFRVPGRKVTKKRRVATDIPDELVPVLERAWNERTRVPAARWVLGDPGSVRSAFEALVKRAGLGPDVTPHVLRHTRVTLLLRAHVDVREVSDMVGASPAMIFRTYGHHAHDARRREMSNRVKLVKVA